ncbi:hypothetical protein [Vescimonas sp.]|uniref:hypothetical protein n=1 Tax=Vescimonas sp. TaxID=2892404 RepID=UPI003079874C
MHNKERGCAASFLIIFSIAIQLEYSHEGFGRHLHRAEIPHLLLTCERIFDSLTSEFYLNSRRRAAGSLALAEGKKINRYPA